MQGDRMSKPVVRSLVISALLAFASAFLPGPSGTALAQGSGAPQAAADGKVVGIAFVGRLVADLDKSVPFYKALGFTQDPAADPAWRKDEFTERLYGLKGMETRMAKMIMKSSSSGKPFAVYLREIKGIPRKTVGGYPVWEPGAPHFGVVVTDAPALWASLEKNGMLRARSWDAKLIPFPGETRGALAYLTDPDGLDIEIINQRPATPAQGERPARPALVPGINHVGLVILDSAKARGFYETLFGGKLVNAESPWLKGDFYDSAVGGHGNVLRFFNESFAEAADHDKRLNFELVEFENRKKPVEPYKMGDIGTSYVGFEVEGLDAFVTKVKATGAQVISDGIPAMRSGTRVVMVRDPDTGAFVQLFEHPKK
jgi:catechol 2,3-dioxygenase-like lactoylglutathione lyase family enzyme